MPMGLSVFKLTMRDIRSSFGRFAALLLIVTLSVGFFSGLKTTKSAMAKTASNYLSELNFYDYRLLSTIGFTEDDEKSFSSESYISLAEGGKSVDALIYYQDAKIPFKFIALPEKINIPAVVEGRMPNAKNECAVDARVFDYDIIGTKITLADENSEAVAESISETEFTVVGTVSSPLYLGNNRGTTDIGSGSLEGFIYISPECFKSEYFTEMYLTLRETATAYSDEYNKLISQNKSSVSESFKAITENRYYNELGVSKDDLALLAALYGVDVDELQEELKKQRDFENPSTYILTRSENLGYASFESDTSIISGIANILPVFFILIAMLVCITTMTRMVDEERTQIGVFKSLGYSNSQTTKKYLLYAGLATLLGWVIGFFLGTWGLPEIFWYAYNSLYDFAPIEYLFNPWLAVLTFVVAMIGILGSTWLSCAKELFSNPAMLIRPRATKAGKRILLERITPLWNKLSFLHKVTLRNMFRYKKRLIMMLVGVSCSAGLVLTAFGARDSMINIGTLQFDNVQKYQLEATFTEGNEESALAEINKLSEIDSSFTCSSIYVDLIGDKNMSSVSFFTFDDTSRLSDFWNFKNGSDDIAFPTDGSIIISKGIADKLSLNVGDELKIRNSERRAITATISGIFDNYTYNYVIASANTYSASFGEWKSNTALLSTQQEDTKAIAEKLTGIKEVTAVTQLSTTKDAVDNALYCLNYIIWIIVLLSGMLEFIVIFNLTNINIAERRREIATVQVLGFYPKEQNSYVLRENLLLSIFSSLIGLPLGILFHRIVMKMIVIDRISFDIYIRPQSYAIALCCTILFAIIINQVMKKQIDKIPMAESLKAVE
ncbi:MAG: FtsX-like permease family protein [Eubacterium sp.]|nr:FtsX-like permease family protein [Eubacterium sp.]